MSRLLPTRYLWRNAPRQILPPTATFIRPFLRLIKNALRTPIIGHVNQKIGDSGGLEFVDSSINIKWELIIRGVVTLYGECANKHLKREQIESVIKWEVLDTRFTHDSSLISRENEGLHQAAGTAT